ncbi:hypothetical protein DW781_05585 [Olsenella sp. AM30-3LB]|uniref:hypothetical protein n=1 Tax=Olsenella sp. AM30-3LB TaxID=2292359 RepID=UPI000E4BA87E|nr:hypothetical protein [Olsenella sp. AM30-3LB]RHD74855.1 hypothetical protein DW781_05585 [Olsenella sp. AM30-3LB]
MKWIYGADGTSDAVEVALAEKGISVILDNSDLSSVPSEDAEAAMCLLGRCVRELAEATESRVHVESAEQ